MPTRSRKYLAFDIETAMVSTSGRDWKDDRPLGISCASTLTSDTNDLLQWHGGSTATPSVKMSRDECHRLVDHLTERVDDGYAILTWNGLGFDFDILAEESTRVNECRQLARTHIDMMFQVFCTMGFPVSIAAVAKGFGIMGKTEGMSGALAPRLWADGDHKKVLEYNAQDVRLTIDVAHRCESERRLLWITQRGSRSSMPLDGGWRTVESCMNMPMPDTEWMNNPISRSQYKDWLK